MDKRLPNLQQPNHIEHHFSPALFQAFYGILDASLIEALSRFHFFWKEAVIVFRRPRSAKYV